MHSMLSSELRPRNNPSCSTSQPWHCHPSQPSLACALVPYIASSAHGACNRARARVLLPGKALMGMSSNPQPDRSSAASEQTISRTSVLNGLAVWRVVLQVLGLADQLAEQRDEAIAVKFGGVQRQGHGRSRGWSSKNQYNKRRCQGTTGVGPIQASKLSAPQASLTNSHQAAVL